MDSVTRKIWQFFVDFCLSKEQQTGLAFLRSSKRYDFQKCCLFSDTVPLYCTYCMLLKAWVIVKTKTDTWMTYDFGNVHLNKLCTILLTSPYPQSYVITSNDKSKVSVNIELIFISDCLFNQKPYCQYTENKNSVLAQHILLWKILCLYKYI